MAEEAAQVGKVENRAPIRETSQGSFTVAGLELLRVEWTWRNRQGGGTMADRHQRFKTLLKAFLVEFLKLFFPELIDRLDLTAITWLEQEVFPDPPSGQRYSVDLIARIPLRPLEGEPRPNEPRQQVLLLHIEIESVDTVEPFRERMFDYYCDMTRKLGLDVLPVAIYLRVGLEGRGRDTYVRRVWDRTPLRFE
jgi:hypothetical protein